MSGAASPRRLLLGDYNRAFRLAGVAQFHCDAIRRIDFEEVMDAFSEDAALQALAQSVRREDIRNFFEKVTSVLFAFHSHAEFAQAIDPAPNRRARHADFAGDSRAA